MGTIGARRGRAEGGGCRRCAGCGTILAADNSAHLCGPCSRDQRDQFRTAPACLPDDFFDTDEFHAACESEDIGKLFKAYRNHPYFIQTTGKPISQTLLARWLGVSQGLVSKLETDRSEGYVPTLRIYAKALHMPQRVLWFKINPGHDWVIVPRARLSNYCESDVIATTSDAEISSLLTASARKSEILAVSNVHSRDLDSLGGIVEQLAIAYLASPAKSMLTQGMEVQQELASRFKLGVIRSREVADFYVALGRVSGILAYAALDLGRPGIARRHISAAWHMAEMAEDNELKAWVRGTQSLIARFDQKWAEATFYIKDGMRYAGAGTSHLRLLGGAAQCAANSGDVEQAIEFLDQAERERDTVGQDSIEGIFGFSRAKQWYYGGSSLMWLPERHALERAEKSSEAAISTWEHETYAQRSLDDEALAHVYLATARIQLHNLDGSMEAVRPILQLPADRRISWISKRVANLGALLESEYYRKSPEAKAARDEFRAYDV
ncbi:MAG: hypothetical protein WBA97_18285 [Actinophytocola sp.]|uniref:hypothetical protein n=1 Tax=Actinophytocola sp. TaxID=1872138 RepID=UPI003C77E08E